MKVEEIPNQYEWVVEQVLFNLVAQGYTILNPDGLDVSQDIVEILMAVGE